MNLKERFRYDNETKITTVTLHNNQVILLGADGLFTLAVKLNLILDGQKNLNGMIGEHVFYIIRSSFGINFVLDDEKWFWTNEAKELEKFLSEPNLINWENMC